MKIIPVKIRKKQASKPMLVDDWDYEILKKRKWSIAYNGYPRIRFTTGNISAHKIIMWCPDGLQVDHIDGNKLNNQKENLRICSHAGNMMNRVKQKNNTSGFKGVCWHKREKKWRAAIGIDGKLKHLGSFKTIEEANTAYQQGAIKYHGIYASW